MPKADTAMRPGHVGPALGAAAYLAALAVGQFVRGPLEPATPALPHTAIFTTTVAQNEFPQAIATVTVTLVVPRDVGHPTSNNGSTLTGTAISHFSAVQKNGGMSTWYETAELLWTTAAGDSSPLATKDALPPQQERAETTLTAVYTDYQHYSVGLYGAWWVAHYEFSSTIRETIVEVVVEAYPATIVRTGYTDVKVVATVATEGGPTTTDPDRDSSTYLRTTTLVEVSASRG